MQHEMEEDMERVQLKIKSIDGRVFDIEVLLSGTVSELKQLVLEVRTYYVENLCSGRQTTTCVSREAYEGQRSTRSSSCE